MSKDLFSKQSDLYARYRPDYPPELIEYILGFVPLRNEAWDCATGNGQAAVLLAPHFRSVKATDISERQIENSQSHPGIQYSIASAENSSFADNSFDLVTVAQAYHWFHFDAFKKELERVLKPNGIIAIWGYSLIFSDQFQLNEIIEHFYSNTVGPYWDAERQYLDEHYRTIPFPFDELTSKDFFIEKQWDIDALVGYFNTWSSVQHFIKSKNFNPVNDLRSDLQKAWPSSEVISFRFPLFLRMGKIKID